MTASVLVAPSRAYVPLRLTGRPAVLRVGAVLAATVFLAACSWIEVPMVPVPITMQSFGVTVVAALFGSRLGTAAVVAWLLEGALGLPVLSAGHGGLAYMAGPTGGYLAAFVLTAAVIGWAAEQGWTAQGVVTGFVLMALANVLMLIGGSAWLSLFVGPDKAIELGVTPFLLGGAVKSALAAAGIEAARRHLPMR